VKLLFDQNLSPRLVQRLADCFPDSMHCSTPEIEAILRRHVADIDNLGKADRLFLLMLY